MRSPRPVAAVVLLASALALPASGGAASSGNAPGLPGPSHPPPFERDRIIVQLAPAGSWHTDRPEGGPRVLRPPGAAASPGMAALNAALGVKRMAPVLPPAAAPHASPRALAAPDAREGLLSVEFEGERDIPEMVRRYAALAEVVRAQPSYVYQPDALPDDPYYALQYAHRRTRAEAGWRLETGDPRLTIALIGSGVERTHPDLAANLWENEDEIVDNGLDDDANGYVDDRFGWSFAEWTADPSPFGHPHETQVAGVAGAVADNGTGVAGVAWNCRLMPLRIAYTSVHVAQALDYARANGAHVINMSFGNYDPAKYGPDWLVAWFVEAASRAGVVLVATAGNDASDAPRYPAALPAVISVAATDAEDARAAFSNHGPWVDVAAPGHRILSTSLGASYRNVSGTSFAAPYVAGLAALLLSRHPDLTPTSVRRRILFSAEPIAVDHAVGAGRVDVLSALALDRDPPPVPAEIALPPALRSALNLSRWPVHPVFLLGSRALDVTQVDVTTLAFGPDGAAPDPPLTDPDVLAGSLRDVNRDGAADLVLHVRSEASGVEATDREACLRGETLRGQPFEACTVLRPARRPRARR